MKTGSKTESTKSNTKMKMENITRVMDPSQGSALIGSGQPLIVLSHHRSGSNFITEMLQYNESVDLLNEPLSMHTHFFLKHDLIPWRAEEFDQDFLHPSLLPFPGVSRFLLQLRDYLAMTELRKIRGFKETLLFEKLPWLKRFMPKAKIIYIIRDPRAVINSVKKNKMWKIWDYEKNIPRFLMQSNLHEFIETDHSDFLASPTNLALLSWKIRYQFAKKSLQEFDYIMLKLEDFICNADLELDRAMKFLGLDASKSQYEFIKASGIENRGKSYSVFRNHDEVLNGWKTGLGREEIRKIELAVGQEMAELGYS